MMPRSTADASSIEVRTENSAVVVDKRVKGMAFSSQIDGVETELFERKQAALDWLSEV